MTISSTNNRNDYVGNGSVHEYDYTFRIFSDTDLLVTVQDDDGVETELTLDTDYSVDGVGDLGGGSVTLIDANQDWLDAGGDLETDFHLTISRVRPIIQETDIRNQGSFFPESHEDTFDHLIMIAQRHQDLLDRSMKLPETVAAAGFDPTLPTDIQGASGLIPISHEV